MPPAPDLQDVLSRYWGYTTFRPLQAEAMDAVLAGATRSSVLPTGGGKSLCFQAPASCVRLAVVVSPFISLMKDQVDTLVGNGVPAALSTARSRGEKARHRAHANGRYRLLYVSPERLWRGGELPPPLSPRRSRFIAIDEAHCISQWGHDFSPEYRQLRELRQLLARRALHAFTATATARVGSDIAAQLGLNDPVELVGTFDRSNLTYRPASRDAMKQVDRSAPPPSPRGRHHLLHGGATRHAGGCLTTRTSRGRVSRGIVGRGAQPRRTRSQRGAT